MDTSAQSDIHLIWLLMDRWYGFSLNFLKMKTTYEDSQVAETGNTEKCYYYWLLLLYYY